MVVATVLREYSDKPDLLVFVDVEPAKLTLVDDMPTWG